MSRPLAIASDHAAFELKAHLKETLTSMGVEFQDLGPQDDASVDYPDFAHKLATAVKDGTFDLGVLVCGTGQGMAISANRHPGVRAALCTDTFSAHMAREHNDANVLCMGARVVGVGLADDILKSFLGASFEGGRHARRVGKIEP